VIEEDQTSASSGTTFHSEYRMIARDGHLVWFRDEAVLVEDPVNDVSFWQGVMLDISEEKRALEHHAEIEAKYRTLVEQLPAVVYLGEYGEGEWIYVSPRLEAVLGYTPREWLDHPHPMGSFVHPEDLPTVRAAEEVSYSTGDPFHAEYRILTKDGRWRWILDEATVVRDAEGKPLFMQGIMYDISDRKEAEERLVALDRLKNTLLHTLSHDLKEPLTAILGAASTLERLDHDLPEEERQHLLHTLAARTRGMNTLLTDLLDLDRLDRGIVSAALPDLEASSVTCGPDRRPAGRPVEASASRRMVNVDGTKIERVIENLLANAARHTPTGSRIWVRGLRACHAGRRGRRRYPDASKRHSALHVDRRRRHARAASTFLVARFAEMHGEEPGLRIAWGGALFRVSPRRPCGWARASFDREPPRSRWGQAAADPPSRTCGPDSDTARSRRRPREHRRADRGYPGSRRRCSRPTAAGSPELLDEARSVRPPAIGR
jgi:PAS domain S-box-containing protein